MIGLVTLASLQERGDRIRVASRCEEGLREGSTGVGGVMS